MLYNGNWDKTTFSLQSFSAWLDQQPPEETYRFIDSENCAVAQYLKSRGVAEYNVCSDRLKELGWCEVVCAPGHHTFGKAALRARLLLRGGLRLWLARFFSVAGLV